MKYIDCELCGRAFVEYLRSLGYEVTDEGEVTLWLDIPDARCVKRISNIRAVSL